MNNIDFAALANERARCQERLRKAQLVVAKYQNKMNTLKNQLAQEVPDFDGHEFEPLFGDSVTNVKLCEYNNYTWPAYAGINSATIISKAKFPLTYYRQIDHVAVYTSAGERLIILAPVQHLVPFVLKHKLKIDWTPLVKIVESKETDVAILRDFCDRVSR